MRLTYAPAGTFNHLWLDNRIIASSVPKMMPPVIARSVSVTVNVMPSLNR